MIAPARRTTRNLCGASTHDGRKRGSNMSRWRRRPNAVPDVMLEGALRREEAGLPRRSSHEVVLETIVRKERPVLFVKDDWLDLVNVTTFGPEAEDLVRDLNAQRAALQPIMPLIGRMDVSGFPGNDFVGTGWFVDTDIVITNRHVAGLIARWDGRRFAFIRGVAGKPITCSVHTLHEFDDLAVDAARVFAVKEVLYIEPESGPDIAFLRVDRRTDGTKPDHIAIAKSDIGDDVPVFVVGYPARASKRVIPDQELMKELYRDRYDVKRAAPGFSMGPEGRATRHDCTTLGGNSGSVVLDLRTGKSVGLHFAGLYQETNYAVPASVLAEYVNKRRWKHVVFEIRPARPVLKPKPQSRPQRPMPQSAGASSGAVTVTIPLSITVSLGQPVDSGLLVRPATGISAGPASVQPDRAAAERAVRAFWDERPDGVIAARVGFYDEGGCDRRRALHCSRRACRPARRGRSGRTRGVPSDSTFATSRPTSMSRSKVSRSSSPSTASAYDDDARTGSGFSFDPVEEFMTVRAHVGPEYSWDELNGFLSGARRVARFCDLRIPCATNKGSHRGSARGRRGVQARLRQCDVLGGEGRR